MRHITEESLTRLGHGDLLLGRGARGLGLDPVGHIALVQQHADGACHRILHRSTIDVVPARALQRHHPVHLGGRSVVQRRIQNRLPGLPILEPVDQAHSLAIGREGARIGEQGSPRRIEQADRPGRMAQRLDGPAFLGPDIRLGRLEQQHLAAIVQHDRRDQRLHRQRLTVGIEGPAFLDLFAACGEGLQPVCACPHSRGQFREVPRQQLVQIGGTPQGQRRPVGIDPEATIRVEQPHGTTQAVPGGQRGPIGQSRKCKRHRDLLPETPEITLKVVGLYA